MRPRNAVRTFLACVAALTTLAPVAIAQDKPADTPAKSTAGAYPRLAPGEASAKPLTVYEWTSKAGETDEHEGLRFSWRLPKDFNPSETYDLVVICHGTGLDYRWGHANLEATEFRTNNIVVSVDGTSEGENNTRLFLGQNSDALTFRDFVLETARSFPVDRIFLYGHSQGSFFVVFVAGQFPGLTEGVVAQSSGAWTNSRTEGGIQSIPIAFMHGTADPVVPYFQSLGAREAFVRAGHPMTLVRRMQGYNHWPNAVRASECLDWCSGMSTSQASTALAAAEALLEPKPADKYNYTAPVPFGAAAQVLRRLTPDDPRKIEEVEPAQLTKAQELLKKIDAEGAKHVESLRQDLKNSSDLVLGLGSDGGAWLGHVIAMREDFRGVPSVEAYLKEIDYDTAAKAQWEAAKSVLDTWYSQRSPKDKFVGIAEQLPHCFLVDALPFDLATSMETWHKQAKELDLPEDALDRYESIQQWNTGWTKGLARYRKLWSAWK